MEKKFLPIGYENFKKLRDHNKYFVDKSLLIKDLCDSAMVTLFTRPRRFGKTLNISMIRTFFEDERDIDGNKIDNSKYFEDLKIWKAGDRYLEEFGKYPIISLTLKELKQPNFKMAIQEVKRLVGLEYRRHEYLFNSNVLKEDEKELFERFMGETAADEMYVTSIAKLCDYLHRYHNKNTIILFDEYDVPLENSYFRGFYTEMVDFIRSFFGSALKTNDALEKAVITGCLRISKESIFTGLNNLDVVSILTTQYGEHFGFTQEEVDILLNYYDLDDRKEEIKEWYDGYLFGRAEVYNPWSVINVVRDCVTNDNTNLLKPYWDNTSSNSIIRDLIERADLKVKGEIENLISGGTIDAEIHEDITYDDVYKSQDNLYNFLFFTGYLKTKSIRRDEITLYATLNIPNLEIKSAYRRKISEWVDRSIENQIKTNKLDSFYNALFNKDSDEMEKILGSELMSTISYFDAKESYYHGFMTGLLKGLETYRIESNKESGEGRFDLALVPALNDKDKLFIIEIKVVDKPAQMEEKCIEALKQVIDKNYKQKYIDDLYYNIHVCAISFCKKRCRVKFD